MYKISAPNMDFYALLPGITLLLFAAVLDVIMDNGGSLSVLLL